MNIFILDTNVVKCAEYHLDKHCVKMILESTQLLNNALSTHNMSYTPIYKPTHLKHPTSIWAALSIENFDWLTNLALALCNEYTHRYGKIHKCQEMIKYFKTSSHRLQIPPRHLMPFVKCMPDQYKVADTVESYRNYYRGDKAYIAKWTKRSVPEWWMK
jgi:hypothetical protein